MTESSASEYARGPRGQLEGGRKSPWFWTNCYPWLFPNSDCNITSTFRKYSFDVRGTSVTSCDYKSWCQQLMMIHDHQFTSDPSCVFHLGKVIQHMQGLSQSIQWNQRNGQAGPR